MKLLQTIAAVVAAFLVNATLAGELTMTDVWSRATPPTATVGAVFMQIRSAQADTLVAVKTPAAQRAEIHTVTHRDGRVEMRRQEQLPIPANQMVSLSPDGTHLMLMGLRQPLVAGKRFQVALTFEHAGERTVWVEVVRPDAR